MAEKMEPKPASEEIVGLLFHGGLHGWRLRASDQAVNVAPAAFERRR